MDKQTKELYKKHLPWILFFKVTFMTFIFWGIFRKWNFTNITALQLFPILGFYAWSIMWTHYIVGAVRIFNPGLKRNELYSNMSGYLVLGLILLHPGLLIWNQWSVSGLKPPESIYG